MTLIDDNSRRLEIGDAMPQFELPNVCGGRIDSAKLSAPMALAVVFTCNHCPYAKQEEDTLIALQNDSADRGVAFVLICSNDVAGYPDDAPEELAKRALEKHYLFPYCSDADQSVAIAYGALCTPHCFLFDRARRLAYKGAVRGLKDAIEALVRGESPATPEVNAIGCSIKWLPGKEPAITRA